MSAPFALDIQRKVFWAVSLAPPSRDEETMDSLRNPSFAGT
jgi:hypothetical protein